jgi:hypothetical protein
MSYALLQGTSRFLFVASLAHNRIRSIDPRGKQYLLSSDASNADLGSALEQCLSASRQVSAQEIKQIVEASGKTGQDWAHEVAIRFGYNSQDRLYEELSACEVSMAMGSIRIEPSNHSGLREWNDDGLGEKDWVVLDKDVSKEKLGAGCRLALSRCTTDIEITASDPDE